VIVAGVIGSGLGASMVSGRAATGTGVDEGGADALCPIAGLTACETTPRSTGSAPIVSNAEVFSPALRVTARRPWARCR